MLDHFQLYKNDKSVESISHVPVAVHLEPVKLKLICDQARHLAKFRLQKAS